MIGRNTSRREENRWQVQPVTCDHRSMTRDLAELGFWRYGLFAQQVQGLNNRGRLVYFRERHDQWGL